MATDGSRQKQKRLGGLSGKARQNKARNRAWRLHSQQLIQDFVDPQPTSAKGSRQIPIKRRAEFAPTAPVMGSKYGVGTEQELELVYSTDTDSADYDDGLFDQAYVIVPPDSSQQSAITFSAPTSARQHAKDDASVEAREREALIGGKHSEPSPTQVDPKTGEDFTARGFVFGCAIGTAAAAVLLMMVRVTFL